MVGDGGTDNSDSKNVLENEEQNFEDSESIVHVVPSNEDFIYAEDELMSDELNENSANIIESKTIQTRPDVSVATAEDAKDALCCVACFPVSASLLLIAAGSMDEKLRFYMYDTIGKNLTLLHTAADYEDTVVDTSFSYDGKLAAAASYDRSVTIYGLTFPSAADCPIPLEIKKLHRLEGPSLDIEWLQWHPKGHVIIAGSKDATIWMWQAMSGNVMMVFTGHGVPVSCGSFANEGKLICTGFADGGLTIWNPKTGEKKFSFGGDSTEGTTRRQLENKKTANFHQEPITNLVAHPVRHLTLPIIASASEDSSIYVLHVLTGRILGTLEGHIDSVESLAFYPKVDPATGGALLASGSLDGTARVWDCSRFVTRCIVGHTELGENEVNSSLFVGGITCVKWAPYQEGNPPLLITASTDCTIRIWNINNQICLNILCGHTDGILTLSVSPNLSPITTIFTGSDDHKLKVWEH